MPELKPADALPDPAGDGNLEDELTVVEEHFNNCKARALENAKQVLGIDFDPSDKKARDSLENSVSPALQQLSDFGRLTSASRLAGLAKLTDEHSAKLQELISDVNAEAKTLAELTSTPDLATRRQLYARVAAWMREQGDTDLSTCKVCGGSLERALEAKTGRLVRDELSDALTGDARPYVASATACPFRSAAMPGILLSGGSGRRAILSWRNHTSSAPWWRSDPSSPD